MKFSLIIEGQLSNPTPERERQLILDNLTQCVYAEQVGFDRIWSVEHHALKWFSHMSAPEVFLSAVAAKTERIRIGHGVVCMPFGYSHPIRVAERAAMLDILSQGRLDLGAGRGGSAQEMSLFSVNPDDTYPQLEEALRIIGSCWREDTFTYHSERLNIEPPPDGTPHSILPRPVQFPHPPLYMACTRADTVRRAAKYGVGALAFGFGGPEDVRRQREMYDEEKAVRADETLVSPGVVNDEFVALCPTLTLDDHDEAVRLGARGQRFFGESITHWLVGGRPAPSETMEHDDNVKIMHERRAEALEIEDHDLRTVTAANFNIDHAYGNADRAIEYVKELADAGADEIMCMISMGTIPHDTNMETIRQWGERVIPQFRTVAVEHPLVAKMADLRA
jgi:alkanesulfonate monooxygenase SsuD/methylene tetrahydromethanopterin reductase-like flavin-dependent oxidoreductase (luciferase family)